jgi:hypothetical protein
MNAHCTVLRTSSHVACVCLCRGLGLGLGLVPVSRVVLLWLVVSRRETCRACLCQDCQDSLCLSRFIFILYSMSFFVIICLSISLSSHSLSLRLSFAVSLSFALVVPCCALTFVLQAIIEFDPNTGDKEKVISCIHGYMKDR